MVQAILVLNSGSSSIKFGVFDGESQLRTMFKGAIVHVDDKPRLGVKDASGISVFDRSWSAHQPEEYLIDAILKWLDDEKSIEGITAVGHRIVHGGSEFVHPTRLTEQSIEAIVRLTPLAPLHQAKCLSPARTLMKLRPDWIQIGCFDTAFHATLSPPASRFPIPRQYEQRGIRRYGFHGLSFEYIAGELEQRTPGSSARRTVVAHLGNGASLCALRDGKSVDTTMGLTPLDGLMMGTRSGTVDPGLVLYLQRENGMSAADVENMLYHDAGLLGVSGISSDMEELLGDAKPEAAEAVDLFTFIAAKDISAMACTLGGLDRLVFTGGIGEHAPQVREMICGRLAWLGIELKPQSTSPMPDLISSASSRVDVNVIPTNEEEMIARHVRRELAALMDGRHPS